MATVKIVYSSCGGNTEIVCKLVQEQLAAAHSVKLLMVKMMKPKDILGADILILACPTYGCGELEPYMEKFIWKAQSLSMPGQRYAIIGLGDVKYHADYVMESANILKEFMVKHEGQELAPALRIANSPLNQFARIERWTTRLIEKIS
jgi:flavodoxin